MQSGHGCSAGASHCAVWVSAPPKSAHRQCTCTQHICRSALQHVMSLIAPIKGCSITICLTSHQCRCQPIRSRQVRCYCLGPDCLMVFLWLCCTAAALLFLDIICRRCDPALLQHMMQGLPFLSFVEEGGCPYNSQDWLAAAEDSLGQWRAAEEQLQAAHHASRHAMLKLDNGTGGRFAVSCSPQA